ncbi:MAG: exodeoxyribonuclease VII large subunit [Acutalibacteraceae bacterium]
MPTVSVITVSQLNSYVKAVLEVDSNLSGVLVSGEISNLKRYNSTGHLYFSLKDDKSVLKAVMFSGDARNLQFEPTDGMKVVAHGRVSCYEISGQYQLYVDSIQPEGLGAVYLAFEQVKSKLMKEGLFDSSFKKPIPKYPSKVGVITSESGAVIHDIKTVAERRFPICDIILYPVEVQGKNATSKIIEGIKYFNNIEKVDTIIVGRGGGSAEDLGPFNDENLAREIFASDIPVISAVGHETDYTICDFVADMRAATPSVAAEIAFPDKRTIINIINDSLIRMKNTMESEISYVQNEKLNNLTNKLSENFENSLEKFMKKCELLLIKLNASNVKENLKKGFSVISSGSIKLKKVEEFKENMKISIAVSDGIIDCEIKNISKINF